MTLFYNNIFEPYYIFSYHYNRLYNFYKIIRAVVVEKLRFEKCEFWCKKRPECGSSGLGVTTSNSTFSPTYVEAGS